MGKKHKNLFERVVAESNFWDAYRKTARNKRDTEGYLRFRHNEAANIALLREAVHNGTYTPSPAREFYVYEPKKRLITALAFQDRVVQHAINNVLNPVFDGIFFPTSYACRTGKGTHRAAMRVQAEMRKRPGAWILKTDFSKYFPSVDHEILYREICRKVNDRKLMNLISAFMPSRGTGICIGNLLSQLSANIYGHIFDRWLVHEQGVKAFVRYMDDTVIFCESREQAKALLKACRTFATDAMKITLSKWSISRIESGVNFCGYRIYRDYKLLRPRSVRNARRKLKMLDGENRERFLASWLGHASWANTYNLLKRIGVL